METESLFTRKYPSVFLGSLAQREVEIFKNEINI